MRVIVCWADSRVSYSCYKEYERNHVFVIVAHEMNMRLLASMANNTRPIKRDMRPAQECVSLNDIGFRV